MKAIKSYKGNIIYIALFSITFILAFLVMKNIPLFGDDYHYATYMDGDFWQMHKEHYLLVNGRAIVHLLATVFLSLPPVLWQVLNSTFLALIVTLAAKHFAFGRGKYIACISSLAMLLALDVHIVRESVYWLTGSFNYVYPFALFMCYWYLLCNSNGKYMPVVYILAFFSAATTEQNSMMTFGVTVLYLINVKFIKKEKLSKRYIFLLVPALAGLFSVFFAPATFARYGLETEMGILEVMKEQFPRVCYSFVARKYMIPFHIFTLVSMGVYLFKTYRHFSVKIIALLNIFQIMLLWYISKTNYDEDYGKIVIAMIIFSFIILVNVILIFVRLLKDKPNGYFVTCTAFILAFGSQIMMCASPVWGGRTMLCGIFNLIIFATGLICSVCEDKKYFTVMLAVSILFLIFGSKIYAHTYTGYKTNFPVTAKNEALIDEYKSNPTGELTQYTVPYAEHCWSMPYVSSYHFYYYKVHYELPSDIQVNWVGYDLAE